MISEKDLMIGNWVFAYGRPRQVEAIYDNGRIQADCIDLSEGEFDPIPLTPEILEKNFPTAGELAWWPVEDGLHCESRNTDDIMVSGVFRFVHQLQNALRLCGIDKSIEL